MTDIALVQPWFSFPQIDPIAFAIGPLAIRWYALSYMAGLLGGWQILRWLAKRPHSPVSALQIDGLLNYVLFGVIVGGRVGYVLFYQPASYLADPFAIFKIWQGGMSFHGGFLGVVFAVWLYTKLHKIAVTDLSDRAALVAPLGLFFGRLANFINGELYGRVTSHPIGMVFPNGGDLPRHPSQLYEAGLEGLVLGIILMMAWRMRWHEKAPGSLVALFLTGYGTARFVVEFAREPDTHLGLYHLGEFGISQGQILSLPMIATGLLYGLWLINLRRTKG